MCPPTMCAAASIPSRHPADATPNLRHEVPCPIRRVLTEVDIDMTVVHIVMIRLFELSRPRRRARWRTDLASYGLCDQSLPIGHRDWVIAGRQRPKCGIATTFELLRGIASHPPIWD